MPKYHGLTDEDLRDLYDDIEEPKDEIEVRNTEFDCSRLDMATPENPVFIAGTLGDGWGDHVQPSWKGMFAVIGPRESDDYGEESRYSMYAIRVDTPYSSENPSRPLQFGDFLVKSADELENMVVVSGAEAERLYQNCIDLHENAPYIASGCLYTDQPIGRYAEYGSIPGSEKTWNLKDERLQDGSPIKSLDDGEKWILENHPAYYVGCGVHQDCPSGDIKFQCVPRAYGEGAFENVANRWTYAAEEAKRLGVTMGTKTWDDELTECLGADKDKIVYQAQYPQKEEPMTKAEKPSRRLPDISGIVDNEAEQSGLDY